nr:RNA-directed DNA polymerase, eukaryota, reverse transcriptase zinc-binding domain protein [Tanacetum cinerariifolium]
NNTLAPSFWRGNLTRIIVAAKTTGVLARWDFLDDVLISFGFGSKWRSWIRGSLSSEKASILVNGSPTPEFYFHRG